MIGTCSFRASNAVSDGNGYDGLRAAQAELILHEGATVSFNGGNGTTKDVAGTRNGGHAITATGTLSIRSLAQIGETKLAIRGGNGGNAYSAEPPEDMAVWEFVPTRCRSPVR